MPNQRGRSLPLHTLAGAHHGLSPAGRAGHPRGLARLLGLHRPAKLRLAYRESDRLRRLARAGDRAHAHRPLRDGGRGHSDQHPAPPRAPERPALPARRYLDPLPRAEARRGDEEKEEVAVAWLSITVELEPAQAEALSEALIDAGADSVALEPGASVTRLTALAARDA